jgi:hypothetical protein
VLSDGDDVGASDLGDGDTAVGLVGGIEVDVVRTNTSSDGELQVLSLGETLFCEVSGVESDASLAHVALAKCASVRHPKRVVGRSSVHCGVASGRDVRRGNDDLCVNKVLVELRVLALLVRGGDELVALVLNPLPDA